MDYSFRSTKDALRYYVSEAYKTEAPPCIASSQFTRISIYDQAGNVVGDSFVPTPFVSPLENSVENRLCNCVDIQICLPKNPVDQLILLARTMFPWRKVHEVLALNDLEISKDKAKFRYGQALAATTHNMAVRGVAPLRGTVEY